jgi:hypothetical protein
MGLSSNYPRFTQSDIDGLRAAAVKVDLAGRVIGNTRIASAELLMNDLAEIYLVINAIIERFERRCLAWRKAHNKLTPEDRAFLASQEAKPAEESTAAEEN